MKYLQNQILLLNLKYKTRKHDGVNCLSKAFLLHVCDDESSALLYKCSVRHLVAIGETT